jgi:hypothetical protein
MIFKIFLPKNFAKKLAFLTQNKAKFWKKFTITLVFKKNANFFAENWGKSQKIVIITSTPERPDWANFRPWAFIRNLHTLVGQLFELPLSRKN